jgi:hypothetical protein
MLRLVFPEVVTLSTNYCVLTALRDPIAKQLNKSSLSCNLYNKVFLDFWGLWFAGQNFHCYSKRVINQLSLAQNNGIPNKFPVRAAVRTKKAFRAVRYPLTRDSLSLFYFAQENVVNHNFDTLHVKGATFVAINLCSTFVRHRRVCFKM